jgi:hypothetical protein
MFSKISRSRKSNGLFEVCFGVGWAASAWASWVEAASGEAGSTMRTNPRIEGPAPSRNHVQSE